MTRIEFWSAVMGLLVAIVVMFTQISGRLDAMNGRIDAMQIENNRRFDTVQAENNRRFDILQADNNEMRAEMSQMRIDVNRRLDQLFEALRVFERRITRLEERTGIEAEQAP